MDSTYQAKLNRFMRLSSRLKGLQRERDIYEYVLDTLCGWNKKHESLGAVIGATQREFKRCVEKIMRGNCSLPLLVPGVGAQGGSYVKIKNVLEELHYNTGIVRINASSSISYAFERYPSLKVEEAAYRAVEELGKT